MTADRIVDSPDGRYQAQYIEDEVRMGHWTVQPMIVDRASGETIFRMSGDIDSQVEWLESGQIAVRTALTYTSDRFVVWLDPAADAAWIDQQTDRQVSLKDATELANNYLQPLQQASDDRNRLAQERSAREYEEWKQREGLTEERARTVSRTGDPRAPAPRAVANDNRAPGPQAGDPAILWWTGAGIALVLLLNYLR